MDITTNEDRALNGVAPAQVRVRFPPSPTGNLHVGNVRSALFNWAFARHFGGTFVLRIEDTDADRNQDGSYEGLLDSLGWLGLDWDEGPIVGGPHGPYIQSERRAVYTDVVARLLASGHAYRCFCSPLDVTTRHAATPKGTPTVYDGFCRDLPADTAAGLLDAAVPFVVRLRVPEGPVSFDDLVRGHIEFPAGSVADYPLVRTNGEPLYALVNPTDDALMRITHVLRGEDLLASTPRQIVLYEALAAIGVGSGRIPTFGHLPTVLGENGRRLSKRDKGAGLAEYREKGYLPEALLNYLALLGWGLSEDRDVFSIAEMVDAFDILRVNANPARFDAKKCEAINASHVRALDTSELTQRLLPYLHRAGLVTEPASDAELRLLAAATPLVAERMSTLGEVVDLLGFLFVADGALVVDPAAGLTARDATTLDAAVDALASVDTFDHVTIETALRSSLIEGLGLKPKLAFGPVRAGVTGRRISPPLFESLELVGKKSAIARLRAARAGITAHDA